MLKGQLEEVRDWETAHWQLQKFWKELTFTAEMRMKEIGRMKEMGVTPI
jgi:hypothetical protein